MQLKSVVFIAIVNSLLTLQIKCELLTLNRLNMKSLQNLPILPVFPLSSIFFRYLFI